MVKIVADGLSKIINNIKNSEYFTHETKRHALYRYLVVLLLFVVYMSIMVLKYGLKSGFLVSLLTWSFFVLCTPIADAGFLFDFPARVITGIRMLYSEIFVWIFAISINLLSLEFYSAIYEKTYILHLFYKILTTPIPYWSIIILSFLGTFLSVAFGDELLDVVFHHERKKWKKHKVKYHAILLLFIFVFIFLLYGYLLERLGLEGINELVR